MEFSNRHSNISVIDAIGPALNHMVKVLFKPFSFIKWVKFGLVAFLVTLGAGGGGGFNFNPMSFHDNKTFPNIDSQIAQVTQWIESHLMLIIILGIAALLVITIIWTILIYFSSRFSFVYLDGVIKNDLQIKRAYKENRTSGWSYFLWNIIFAPTALLIILLIIGVPVTFLVIAGATKSFSVTIILLLGLLGLIFIALMILLAVIGVFTHDFVVPIMYLRKIRVLEAWKILLALMRPNKLQFFLYILMKIGLGLASTMLLLIPGCLVCCCFFLPAIALIGGLGYLAFQHPLIWILVVPIALIALFIGSWLQQTIISPITVFFRTYPLIFLEGFGNEFVSINKSTSVNDSLPQIIA